MQCLNFAQRKERIPLPNVIRDIVAGYLGNQLIPVDVIDIPIYFQVIMISGKDVYYRYDNCVYKNTTFVFKPGKELAKRHWFAFPVIGDWIFINYCLCNISSGHTINLSMQLHSARVFGDHLYFISPRYNVLRLSLHALDSVPEYCHAKAKQLHVVGNCLMFAYEGGIRFHDSDTIYRGEYIAYLYRWQNKIYEISVDGILCNGNQLAVFDKDDDIDDMMNVFAVNENLLIDTLFNRHVFDCDRDTCQSMNKREVLCDQSDRLWAQSDSKLLIYH